MAAASSVALASAPASPQLTLQLKYCPTLQIMTTSSTLNADVITPSHPLTSVPYVPLALMWPVWPSVRVLPLAVHSHVSFPFNRQMLRGRCEQGLYILSQLGSDCEQWCSGFPCVLIHMGALN